MGARVELDALDNVSLAGELERIAATGINRNGIVSYKVDVLLQNADGRVRPGMTAEAFIQVATREDVVRVPNNFIRFDTLDETIGYVSILNAEQQLTEVDVEVGLRGETYTEILSGLAAGDTIVLDPTANAGSNGLFGG
jgi:multidrug efflux pump subunit AcrA (membrane-fusion protein)